MCALCVCASVGYHSLFRRAKQSDADGNGAVYGLSLSLCVSVCVYGCGVRESCVRVVCALSLCTIANNKKIEPQRTRETKKRVRVKCVRVCVVSRTCLDPFI